MKKILFLILCLSVAMSGTFAQTDKKAEKKARKEQKELEHQAAMDAIATILESKSYNVEFQTLINWQGVTVPVNKTLNFLQINGEESTLQIAGASGPGFNGLGGITLDGKVTNYDINRRKNNFSVRIDLFGAGGSANVFMDVMADGFTQITVSGMSSNKIDARGYTRASADSKIFKGTRSN